MIGALRTPARRHMPGFWLVVTLAAVGMLVLWVSSPAVASLTGNQLNQKLPISADSPKYLGDDELCEGTPAGAAIWHFVLTKTTASSATLEVTFAGIGTTQYPSVLKTGGTLHWYVTTASPATLTAASTNARGNRLNLSEICDGGPANPPTVDPTFNLETDVPTVVPTATFDLETA